MVHNKIIFLDVDGVINIPNYIKFDKNCLNNLRLIIEKTGAKIIVSSSWRTGSLVTTKQALTDGGFPNDLLPFVIGETLRKWSQTIKGSHLKVVRGNEIGTWVDRNLRYAWHDNPDMLEQYKVLREDGSFKMMRSNVSGKDFSYVILDDDNDMLLCQSNYFVHTDGLVGLTKENVKEAVYILNRIDELKPPDQHLYESFITNSRKRTHED